MRKAWVRSGGRTVSSQLPFGGDLSHKWAAAALVKVECKTKKKSPTPASLSRGQCRGRQGLRGITSQGLCVCQALQALG